MSLPTKLVLQGSGKSLESVFRLAIIVIIIRMVISNPENQMSYQNQDG